MDRTGQKGEENGFSADIQRAMHLCDYRRGDWYDIVLATKSDKWMVEGKKGLAERFDVKDMGELHHFLGIKEIQNPQTGEVWICQEAYAQKVLQKFGANKHSC